MSNRTVFNNLIEESAVNWRIFCCQNDINKSGIFQIILTYGLIQMLPLPIRLNHCLIKSLIQNPNHKSRTELLKDDAAILSTCETLKQELKNN